MSISVGGASGPARLAGPTRTVTRINHMYRLPLLGFLAGVLVLIAVADASARPFFAPGYRPAYRPAYRPYFPPNRMPGWDWRYIYPYSAYNLERRYYPYYYPYPVPYPVYTQGPTTV